jgi:hypothetical protein
MPEYEDLEEPELPDWLFQVPEIPNNLNCYSRKNTLKFTNETTVKRVYALGRILSKVFHDFDLNYWTSGGTTLGLVRHGGLIPWDDDLDFCILQQDEPVLVKNIADVLKTEYQINVVPANSIGWRIFHSIDSEELVRSELINYRYPFCDVFVMSKHRKNRFCHIADRTGRTIWPKETYRLNQVHQNCQLRPFADYYLKCPVNPETYLDKTYGPDWKIVGATQSYCHVTRESVGSLEFMMENYKPALPFT